MIMFQALPIYAKWFTRFALYFYCSIWKNFGNFKGTRPPRTKFSWKKFKSRIKQKYYVTLIKLFPRDTLVMPLFSYFFIDPGILVCV